MYRSRRRQVLIMAGMVGLFVLLWAQTQQPDYETHVKPAFSRYVWELAPFLGLTIVMAVRSFRVRTVTTASALHLYRVLGHERFAWSEVTGFEVHPSPSGRLLTVKARLSDRRTVKISSFWVHRRHDDPAPGAEQLAAQLRADRRARASGEVPSPPVASATPISREVARGR